MEEMHKRIEKRAYDLFLERGMFHGNDIGDWLKAEKEIIAGDDKKSSKKKTLLKKGK